MSSNTGDNTGQPIRIPRCLIMLSKEDAVYSQYLPSAANKNKVAAQKVTRVLGEIYLVEDRILDSVTWVLQFSDTKHPDVSTRIRRTTELGCTVTSGSEVDASLSIRAGYSGFGCSVNLQGSASYKHFSILEARKVTAVSEEYAIPPRHSVWVYNKQYTFHGRMWVWDKQGNLRLCGRGGPLEGSYSLEIVSDETAEWNETLKERVGSLVVDSSGLIVPDEDWNPYDKNDYVGQIVVEEMKKIYPWLHG